MSNERIQPSTIDVEISADTDCNSLKINAYCYRAIQARAETLGIGCSSCALAKLEVRCPGYDQMFGCQAEIDGALYDELGELVPGSEIHTTARELLDPNNLA